MTTEGHHRLLDEDGNISCIKHRKKVQAFCMTELQVLCIDCLIQEQEKHKQHEILGLEDAAKIERSKILLQTRNSEKKKEDIRSNIFNLKSHLMTLEEQSRQKRAQTS